MYRTNIGMSPIRSNVTNADVCYIFKNVAEKRLLPRGDQQVLALTNLELKLNWTRPFHFQPFRTLGLKRSCLCYGLSIFLLY